jgi:hypothetical protein
MALCDADRAFPVRNIGTDLTMQIPQGAYRRDKPISDGSALQLRDPHVDITRFECSLDYFRKVLKEAFDVTDRGWRLQDAI